MVTSLEFALVLWIVQHIFAVTEKCCQAMYGYPYVLSSIGAWLPPPIWKELLLRLKARVLEAGVCEHQIDRLNLVLL